MTASTPATEITDGINAATDLEPGKLPNYQPPPLLLSAGVPDRWTRAQLWELIRALTRLVNRYGAALAQERGKSGRAASQLEEVRRAHEHCGTTEKQLQYVLNPALPRLLRFAMLAARHMPGAIGADIHGELRGLVLRTAFSIGGRPVLYDANSHYGSFGAADVPGLMIRTDDAGDLTDELLGALRGLVAAGPVALEIQLLKAVLSGRIMLAYGGCGKCKRCRALVEQLAATDTEEDSLRVLLDARKCRRARPPRRLARITREV